MDVKPNGKRRATVRAFGYCASTIQRGVAFLSRDAFKNSLQKLQASVILSMRGHKNKYQT